jgi:hypothetical protein
LRKALLEVGAWIPLFGDRPLAGSRTSKIRLTKSRAGRVDAAKKFSRRCAQPVEGCEVRAGHYHRVPWSCASQWIRSRLRGTLVPPIPRWRASGPLQAILAALGRHLRNAFQGPGDRRSGVLVDPL